MLVQLSIQNYAIVTHFELELALGMTVITGETGAGKSIMLDALGLALGDRCDSSVVKQDASKAEILASFDIQHIPEAKVWLAERDLNKHEEVCLLRRVINQDGRSRGYINNVPCPLSDLKQLGELLIDIHSQHEHQSLLKIDTHRRLLDEYADCKVLAEQVKNLAQSWQHTQQLFNKKSSQSDEQQAKQQLLRYQLDELEALALTELEVEQLEAEQQRLSEADNMLAACQQAITMGVEGETNLLSMLNTTLKRLTGFKQPQQELLEAINLLSSAQIQVEEAMDSVNHFMNHFDANPERLQTVEERLDTVYRLARKHHIQPSELFRFNQQLRLELNDMQNADASLEELAEQLSNLNEQYQTQASLLSRQRKVSAANLAQAVEQEIQVLGMEGGRFSVELVPIKSTAPQLQGQETIEFLVSANAGQPLRPLNKVASGGELSRISLAIQVITAQTSRVPTLVFDEVDVGIGGPTAEIVGQLLRRLGEQGQVLTVTHLPQVAAQGHHHLYVYKKQTQAEVQTAVTLLDNKQRIEEIARMLGGVDLTKESLAHAKKMLATV